MSLYGKRDNFELDDFKVCAKNASMKRGRAEEILRQVQDAILRWKDFAAEAGVPDNVSDMIQNAHRTDIVK